MVPTLMGLSTLSTAMLLCLLSLRAFVATHPESQWRLVMIPAAAMCTMTYFTLMVVLSLHILQGDPSSSASKKLSESIAGIGGKSETGESGRRTRRPTESPRLRELRRILSTSPTGAGVPRRRRAPLSVPLPLTVSAPEEETDGLSGSASGHDSARRTLCNKPYIPASVLRGTFEAMPAQGTLGDYDAPLSASYGLRRLQSSPASQDQRLSASAPTTVRHCSSETYRAPLCTPPH